MCTNLVNRKGDQNNGMSHCCMKNKEQLNNNRQ